MDEKHKKLEKMFLLFMLYKMMDSLNASLVLEKGKNLYKKYEFFWYKLEELERLYKMSIEDEKDEILKKIEKWCVKKRDELDEKVGLTAFIMCLNHKIRKWYEKDDDIARMYNDLWMDFDNKIEKKLKDDDLSYYYRTTD